MSARHRKSPAEVQAAFDELFDGISDAERLEHEGRMIGSFGDAEVFSFHATKFVNSLEGGAIVTNNDDLARTARMMMTLSNA